ncbi:hypothetical protein JCM3775_001411 [Rhodotorula graminis]|uniref:Tyrosine specific protein phosphatases domain-containing protein n=1 Tax=Rhodotorula graminis (strain WP1) TaxID=578459 RepID=A0A194S6L3_RHOGW|nr:uncharacterized protein RHOBADRAFT_21654 [Rhodotorula graminis WP1]KPV76368.1 hypothetical protein RHOBADRAFT_21654 [Rhodotorula graminis WP1]
MAAPKRASLAPPPPFLTPSRNALHSALAALQEREYLRRASISDTRPRHEPAQGRTAGQANTGERDWFAVGAASSRTNRDKNRYGDILAYDRTRCLPPLRTAAARDEAGYVNASLVREPDLGFDDDVLPRRWWVAAQAPVPHTVHDFLSLLLSPPTSLSHQASGPSEPLPLVNLVVQLTPLVEGRRQKCHPYFPTDFGATARLASASGEAGQGVWVRLEGKEERDGARTSELRVGREGDDQGRRVVHVEYLGWRDHGVPDSPAHLVRFIHRIHALNASLSSPGPAAPILAHCSAGVGRTGTLLALSSLLPLLSHLARARPPLSSLPLPSEDDAHPLGAYPAQRILGGGPGAVDYVGLTVDGLRDQRTTMCQTAEQVQWVWEAARVAWDEGLLDGFEEADEE